MLKPFGTFAGAVRAFAVLVPAISLGAIGQALATDIAYEVRANSLRFGLLTATPGTKADHYTIHVEAEAQGLLGLILRSQYSGEADGTISPNGRLTPHRFWAKSDRILKHRDIRILFEKGRPAQVTLSPEKDRTAFTDPTQVSENRVDSLSYFYLMLTTAQGQCAPSGQLYDGRRLTSISFEPPKSTEAGTVCTGRYEITDGPDHSIQSGQRRFDLTLGYPETGGAPDQIIVISGGNTVTLTRQNP